MNVNLNIFLSVTLLVVSTKVSKNSTQNHKDKSISKVRNWSYTTELLLRRHADMFREESAAGCISCGEVLAGKR